MSMDLFHRELEDRFGVIEPHIRGKKVLDIACGGTKRSFSLLHKKISSVAAETRGIDSDRELIRIMKRDGHNVQYGDAEDFDLGEKFDVIVAGEIIEHLQNLRGFLQSCKKHMRKDSVLIITTPNVYNIDNLVVLFVKKLMPSMNHTVWFDEDVIRNLLEWNGFKIERMGYVSRTKFPATRYLRYKTLIVFATMK